MKIIKNIFIPFFFPVWGFYMFYKQKSIGTTGVGAGYLSYVLSLTFCMIYLFKKTVVVDLYQGHFDINPLFLFLDVVVSSLAGGVITLWGLGKLLIEVL